MWLTIIGPQRSHHDLLQGARPHTGDVEAQFCNVVPGEIVPWVKAIQDTARQLVAMSYDLVGLDKPS